jgi:hypothetical protein
LSFSFLENEHEFLLRRFTGLYSSCQFGSSIGLDSALLFRYNLGIRLQSGFAGGRFWYIEESIAQGIAIAVAVAVEEPCSASNVKVSNVKVVRLSSPYRLLLLD